jgi:hypothetical protein
MKMMWFGRKNLAKRPSEMTEFRRRRFWLACFFSMTTTIGFFMAKLSGGEYISAMTLILGLYAAVAWKETKDA